MAGVALTGMLAIRLIAPRVITGMNIKSFDEVSGSGLKGLKHDMNALNIRAEFS
jgi:hypothetical protein